MRKSVKFISFTTIILTCLTMFIIGVFAVTDIQFKVSGDIEYLAPVPDETEYSYLTFAYSDEEASTASMSATSTEELTATVMSCSADASVVTEAEVPERIRHNNKIYTVERIYGGDDPSTSNGAFSYCFNLTKIILPDSIKEIGGYAFELCSNLTSINIPSKVITVGCNPFKGCSSIRSGLGEITIDKNNEKYITGEIVDGEFINYNAIYDKINNELITGSDTTTIPLDCVSINNHAFDNSKIGSIKIPETVTSIGDYAFSACSSLQDIQLPSSLRHIGKGAFGSCEAITSLVIPEGITVINNSAFWRCSSLQDIQLPSSLLTIGERAFESCDAITNLVIPEGVINIGNEAFSGCDLETVQLPSSLLTIGERAFETCGLSNIEIPVNVTHIGDNAFDGNNLLQNATITSQNVPSFGSSVFNSEVSDFKIYVLSDYLSAYQSTLESEYTPYLTSMPLTFSYDASTLTATVTDCSNSATSVHVPSSIGYSGNVYTVTSIAESAISGLTNCSLFTIGCKIKSIGKNGLSNNTASCLIIFYPGSELTSIGSGAFQGTQMASIKIPKGVTFINSSVFSGCSSLYSVELHDNIKTIENSAFYGCSSLTSITLPDSITYIGYQSFRGCEDLTSIELPENLETIDTYAFYGCTSLSSIEIPDGVTIIQNSTFYGCSNLTTVVMSDNVNAFANYAFYECSSLSSITMPANLTYIGYVAFYRCKGLTSIDFPEKLETIDTYAFYECTSLLSINIPEKVKKIGDNAFYGCTKLASINVNNSTPFTLGSSVFENNASGRKIYVPSSAVSAYKSATNWSSYSGSIVAKS